MKTLLATAFGLALSLPLAASADDFQTIDKITRLGSNVLVKGIPVGGTQPVELMLSQDQSHGDACEKYALLALTRPGRYIFTGYSSWNSDCALTTRQ